MNASNRPFPSNGAREFSARLSRINSVDVRARLRDRYEALCSRSPGYTSDHYDHRSECKALDEIDEELKRLGV